MLKIMEKKLIIKELEVLYELGNLGRLELNIVQNLQENENNEKIFIKNKIVTEFDFNLYCQESVYYCYCTNTAWTNEDRRKSYLNKLNKAMNSFAIHEINNYPDFIITDIRMANFILNNNLKPFRAFNPYNSTLKMVGIYNGVGLYVDNSINIENKIYPVLIGKNFEIPKKEDLLMTYIIDSNDLLIKHN